MNKRTILVVGISLEVLLAVIFFVWAWYRDFSDTLLPTFEQVGLGVWYAVILCFVNLFVFGYLGSRVAILNSANEFVDKVVKPLADQLGVISGLVISICAGVGEELFFRGVLQNELGLTLASLLFALLHFGPAVRHFLFIAFFYWMIGLYFGIIYEIYGTLWVPIIMHCVYDYLALLYLRYCYTPVR